MEDGREGVAEAKYLFAVYHIRQLQSLQALSANPEPEVSGVPGRPIKRMLSRQKTVELQRLRRTTIAQPGGLAPISFSSHAREPAKDELESLMVAEFSQAMHSFSDARQDLCQSTMDQLFLAKTWLVQAELIFKIARKGTALQKVLQEFERPICCSLIRKLGDSLDAFVQWDSLYISSLLYIAKSYRINE